MKLSCTQENFQTALTSLERVVGKQSTLPILSNILLETTKGQLQLSATNLEIAVITSVGAKIESEGKITVPAKLLVHFIQNLASDQVVNIEQMGTQVVLQSGNYTVKLNGLDGKDFPIIPEKVGGMVFSLGAEVLRQGLQKTLFSVSLNESRSELTGVLLGFHENKVYLTATDSFRLAEWWIEDGGEDIARHLESHKNTVIIPAYTLQEVLRVISQKNDRVIITLEENQIFFETENTRIISRLINGKFPEYQAIIPKQYAIEVTLSRGEFQRALKMANSFSAYNSGEVTFQLNADDGQVEIRSLSQGIGEQIAKIPFEETVSETFSIIFNPRHIFEGVSALSGEQVRISLNSPTTPVRISSVTEQDGYTYIVMPIRK